MTEALEVARLSSREPGFPARLEALLDRAGAEDAGLLDTVREVIRRVRLEGDTALLEFTRRFDGLEIRRMEDARIAPAELAAAWQRIGKAEREALGAAADRIRAYHEHQLGGSWSYEDELGNELGTRVTPLDRVGIYVPGGQASYPSTVLMTAVPAQVAGVGEIVMVVPTPGGERNDLVLAAAHLTGVGQVFTIGGAQAVAALALGTDTVPRVDKIVGPGGVFVTAAKRLVYGEVGIDMVAGPTEVLILADGTTPVDWMVFDLFSQAEHDPAAQAILLCPDPTYLDAVARAMAGHLQAAPRREIIAASLARWGALIETADLEEAVALANRIAPEHLQLCLADPDAWLPEIRHAGAIFVGAHSPEAMGDYIAGPSHVLPTFGSARFSSPLGVPDFQKRSSIIRLSVEGSRALAPHAATLARGEGLAEHARAAASRSSGSEEAGSEP